MNDLLSLISHHGYLILAVVCLAEEDPAAARRLFRRIGDAALGLTVMTQGRFVISLNKSLVAAAQ